MRKDAGEDRRDGATRNTEGGKGFDRIRIAADVTYEPEERDFHLLHGGPSVVTLGTLVFLGLLNAISALNASGV